MNIGQLIFQLKTIELNKKETLKLEQRDRRVFIYAECIKYSTDKTPRIFTFQNEKNDPAMLNLGQFIRASVTPINPNVPFI